jgi:UrcA family protein
MSEDLDFDFGGESDGGGHDSGSDSTGGDWSGWSPDSIGALVGGLFFLGLIGGAVALVVVTVGALFGAGTTTAVVSGAARSQSPGSSVGNVLDAAEDVASFASPGGGSYAEQPARDNRYDQSQGYYQEQRPLTLPNCSVVISQARDRRGRNWESAIGRADRQRCAWEIAQARGSWRSPPTQRAYPPPQLSDPRNSYPPRDSERVQRQGEALVGDLDLSNRADAETMLRRIDRTAQQVCGGRPDTREIKEMQGYRKCLREAKDRAVADLNSPVVTDLHYAGR